MDSLTNNSVEEELRSALEASGHRYTTQRAAVYTYLRNVKSHPTADEIFTNVRKEKPDISLATVYKALEAFVSAGAARKLEFGGGPSRYDGRTDDHHHVRCLKCGVVHDVDDQVVTLNSEHPTRDGFEVVGYRLELLGYCHDCRN